LVSRWPGGLALSSETGGEGVVRVLNIVPEECRLLASSERCPFLVQMEVLETGLSGSDPQIFINGDDGPPPRPVSQGGNTATTQFQPPPGGGEHTSSPPGAHNMPGWSTAAIPTAYDGHSSQNDSALPSGAESWQQHLTPPSASFVDDGGFVRGGWQDEDHSVGEQYGNFENYNQMRQQSFEQLHEQMAYPGSPGQQQQDPSEDDSTLMGTRHLPLGSELLNHIYGSPWKERCEQIRQSSHYGNVPGWKLASFIIKAGEDIRRESLVMQVISKLRYWFEEEILPSQRPYLRPYTITCIGGDAGLLECVPDAKSVDEVKKETLGFTTLRNYFERAYAAQPSNPAAAAAQPLPPSLYSDVTFEKAQDNFLRSLVGYSLVCYILQVKDRHNANILLDREGHLLHIDFGFVLGDTPKM
jgi:hypothetical protein